MVINVRHQNRIVRRNFAIAKKVSRDEAEWDIDNANNKNVKGTVGIAGGFVRSHNRPVRREIDALTPKVLGELVAHYCSIENAMVKQKADNNN